MFKMNKFHFESFVYSIIIPFFCKVSNKYLENVFNNE